MRRSAPLIGLGLVALIAAALVGIGLRSSSGPGAPGREDLEVEPVDVASEAGIDREDARTWGARAGDLDGDGFDDLVISLHKRGVALYRNDRGRFVDATEATLPPFDLTKPQERRGRAGGEEGRDGRRFTWHRDRHDCLPGDVNGSGRADIYCTVGGRKGSAEPNPNELWIQRPDGSFREAAREHGIDEPFGRGRFAAFIDANGDEWPDLFVGSQPGVELAAPNRLFINERARRYRNAPEYGLEQEVGADSAQAVDFDRDGHEDLLICGADGGPAVLYRNVGGERFERVNDLIEGSLDCRYAALEDLDADGAPDLIVLDNRTLTVWLQRDGGFGDPDHAYPVDKGKRFAVGSVTGDDLADIYVVQTSAEENFDDVLFVNRGPGNGFVGRPVPHTGGIGQSVTAIDHRGDGRTAFLVLNGKGTTPGPIRLLEFRER